MKICQNTEDQKVAEQNISQKCSQVNSFVVTSHLINDELLNLTITQLALELQF